jgi:GNAT superfamily N-acetyltransferase
VSGEPRARLRPVRLRLREPRPGDYGWVVQAHGAMYAREFGYDASFEGLVAGIVSGYLAKRDPKRERAWIADLGGAPVGSVFCVRQSATVAKLRLLILDAKARGHGAGRRLVSACIRYARARGYRKLVLWTQADLYAARAIYVKTGFRLVKTEPHRSFGKRLVGEYWELRL